MQLLDGFIVGIYNYCDRWCEACPFTSRCRVFAAGAEFEASLDPQFLVMGAGLLRSVAAIQANLASADALVADARDEAGCDDDRDEEDFEEIERRLAAMSTLPRAGEDEAFPDEHAGLRARARDYLQRVDRWLRSDGPGDRRDPHDPHAVIAWFHMMIAVKIDRALRGVRDVREGDEFAAEDAAGSGKVALLGIERSHASWIGLVERGQLSMSEAEPFIADLVFLGAELERVVPGVREFVRAGFDEPEAVARLAASEAGEIAGPS